MSDTFDHAGDAWDRLYNGEGEGEYMPGDEVPNFGNAGLSEPAQQGGQRDGLHGLRAKMARGPPATPLVAEGDTCPGCNVGMVKLRTNSQTGSQFYGCSEYRNGCRWSRNIASGEVPPSQREPAPSPQPGPPPPPVQAANTAAMAAAGDRIVAALNNIAEMLAAWYRTWEERTRP